MTSKNILGDTIRKLRTKKGYSLIDFSKMVKKTTNTVLAHEKGELALNEEDILQYATALGTTPEDLFSVYKSQNEKKN